MQRGRLRSLEAAASAAVAIAVVWVARMGDGPGSGEDTRFIRMVTGPSGGSWYPVGAEKVDLRIGDHQRRPPMIELHVRRRQYPLFRILVGVRGGPGLSARDAQRRSRGAGGQPRLEKIPARLAGGFAVLAMAAASAPLRRFLLHEG